MVGESCDGREAVAESSRLQPDVILMDLVMPDMAAMVRVHVSSILGKLQVSSRTQAALYALREGLASLGEMPA